MFFGDKVFEGLGIPQPDLYVKMKTNRMQTMMFCFMMNNMAASMTKTNAFEVSYDGKLVFSKLEESRIPELAEVVTVLRAMGLETAKRTSFSGMSDM